MADGRASYRCLLAKAGDAMGKQIDHATSSTQDIVDTKNDVAAIVGLTPGGTYLADVIAALIEGGVAAGDQAITKKYGVTLPGVAEKLGALVEKWGCGTIPRADAPVNTAGRVVTPEAAPAAKATGAYVLQASPYMTSAQMIQAALAARNAFVNDAGVVVDPNATPALVQPGAASLGKNTLLIGAAALAALLFLR